MSTNTVETTAHTGDTPHALPAKVRTLLPGLAQAQRQVAEAVVADPAGCARMTVTELADHTATSETTVVRTARLLGYTGYRDLRTALVELAARERSDEQDPDRTVGGVGLDDPLDQVVAKLAGEERQVLADTAVQLDIAVLDAVITALTGARRIDVYGVGTSGIVGEDLAAKLMRIGLVAHAYGDPHRAIASAVQLTPADVALAISHSGTTADVVDPLRRAAANGATTIAITGTPRSPVAQHSGLVLTTAAAQGSDLRSASMSSRTGQLLIVDCLFTGAAQRTYHTTARRGLAASYRAVSQRHGATATATPPDPRPRPHS
ncbi:MurR/RpiR family transcriptional regulator [Streptomyces sp. NPDC048659]|uniref:MurR/RpiR family transcriptional regulator n=1 Tax=Streptomyces sp. NPDC048659 TaxID=3155489 RepID=UPI00342995C1